MDTTVKILSAKIQKRPIHEDFNQQKISSCTVLYRCLCPGMGRDGLVRCKVELYPRLGNTKGKYVHVYVCRVLIMLAHL